MDRYDIQKLRDIPVEGVAERLGLKVSRHKSLCPFHEDSHPSLTFNVSKNTFKCYVCNAHGGVIDLAMHVLGKNFLESCQWLANENSIILTEWKPAEKKPKHEYKLDTEWLASLVKQPVLNAEAQDFLFNQRHYNKAVVCWLGISSISYPTPCWRYGRPYYDAPSLLIPYRDVEGNLLSVQSRYLGKTCLEDNTAKRSGLRACSPKASAEEPGATPSVVTASGKAAWRAVPRSLAFDSQEARSATSSICLS